MAFAVSCWLRLGTGRYAAVAFLAVGMLALLSRGTGWQGEWAWTLDWAAGTTILSGALLSGAAAFEAAVVRASGLDQLSRGLPRRTALTWTSTAALWLYASAAYLAVLLLASSLTLMTRPGGQPSLVPTVLALLALAAFASVGVIVGTLFAPWVAGPVAVVVGFGLTLLGANGTIPSIFRVGGVTGSLVGLTWSPRVNLEIAAALMGVCLLAWATVRLRGSVVAQYADIAVLCLGSLLLSVAFVDLTLRGDERFQYAGRTKVVCAGSAPRTCLAEPTQRQLPALASAMTRSAQPLKDVGVVLPARFVQEIPGVRSPRSSGVIYVPPHELNRSRPAPGRAADYLSTPARCPQYYGNEPPERALTARSVIADWIRFQLTEQPPDSGSREARWLSTQPRQAADWVRDTYALLRTCRLDSVALPFNS